MGKLRQIIRKWIDRMVEKSFHRQSDSIFMKHQVRYKDKK